MRLGDKVQVELEISGEVVGRTFGRDPTIDLKTPWGMLQGVPVSVLEARKPAEPEGETAVPANVTQIASAVRKTEKPILKAS